MKKTNNNFLKLIFSIVIIIALYQTQAMHNFNFISKNSFDERINKIYGFCSGESIGYLKYLKKEFKFKKNPKIINYKHTAPVSWAIINPKQINIFSDKIILLNYPGKYIKLKNINNQINSYTLNNISFYKDKIKSIKNLRIIFEKNFSNSNLIVELYSETKFGKRKFIKKFNKIDNTNNKEINFNLNLAISDIYPKNNNINFKIKNLKNNKITEVSFIAENRFNIEEFDLINNSNACFFIKQK